MPTISLLLLKLIDRNTSPKLLSILTRLLTSSIISYKLIKYRLLVATTRSSILLTNLRKNRILFILLRGILKKVARCFKDISIGTIKALGFSKRKIRAILILLVTNNILYLLLITSFSNTTKYIIRTSFLYKIAP